MIPKDTIDQIFDAAIIEDVIGDFVNLKKSGSNYKGLSPFTNEKTASFYVSPAKGIFKCFSSGKGGNVVNFLMEHERMSYPEALKYLADKYNITVEEKPLTAEELAHQNERESLALVTSFAHQFFIDQMHNTDEGKSVALSYFRDRGFNDHTIEKFGLGYCPEKGNQVTKAALEKGYKQEYLVKTGLTKEGERGAFDFFRGRVIFPIRNVSGKTIGFGARTLRNDKKVAKYFNSPESDLYHKSRVLYGIDLAKHKMIQDDECYLTEGYTDVIALHQAGIENVVASSGTSLTEDQIRLIRRYTENVTILFDGDAAGIKASFRGIDMLLEKGLNVRVVLFPEGEDPDSYSRKLSSSELDDFISNAAQDFIAFKSGLLAEEAASDPLKRAALIKNIVKSISLIPDAIKRSVYIQESANLLKIDEKTLINEVNKELRGKISAQSGGQYTHEIPLERSRPAPKEHRIELEHQEKDLVRLLLTYGQYQIEIPSEENIPPDPQITNKPPEPEMIEISVAEYLVQELEADDLKLQSDALAIILDEYIEHLDNDSFPKEDYFSRHPNPDVGSIAADIMASPHLLSENWTERHQIYPETEDLNLAKAVKDIIYRIKIKKVQLLIQEIQKELEKGVEDEDRMMELMQKKMRLDKAKTDLSKYFGSAIIQ